MDTRWRDSPGRAGEERRSAFADLGEEYTLRHGPGHGRAHAMQCQEVHDSSHLDAQQGKQARERLPVEQVVLELRLRQSVMLAGPLAAVGERRMVALHIVASTLSRPGSDPRAHGRMGAIGWWMPGRSSSPAPCASVPRPSPSTGDRESVYHHHELLPSFLPASSTRGVAVRSSGGLRVAAASCASRRAPVHVKLCRQPRSSGRWPDCHRQNSCMARVGPAGHRSTRDPVLTRQTATIVGGGSTRPSTRPCDRCRSSSTA